MANGTPVSGRLVIGRDSEGTLTSDDDLSTELENVSGLLADAVSDIEDVNYVDALDAVDQIQEIVNRAHAYLSGKIE